MARREEKINAYRILVETELGGGGRDLETDKWQAVVNTVRIFDFHTSGEFIDCVRK